MIRAFVDTSAWYAFINAADPEHRAVTKAFRVPGQRLVTSNFVLDELITLCRYRLGHPRAAKAGETLMGSRDVELIRVTPADESEAWSLFLARPDKTYSFTDCTSFVLMRRLKLIRALSVDDDFAREGFDTFPR
jgi:uncharacterized protein